VPLKIVVTVKGLSEAYKYVGAVKRAVKDSGKDISIAALNSMGEVFEKNFISEGMLAGGWPQLAESTVEDRRSQGFGGEHPILIRYGDLRDWTATALRTASGSGTFGATDAGGKSIRVSINANRRGAIVIASGEKAQNQNAAGNRPARPYWFTTPVVQKAARDAAIETLDTTIKRAR